MPRSSLHLPVLRTLSITCFFGAASLTSAVAQEQSVKPGINESFKNPAVDEFVGRFEVESREIYANRRAILQATAPQPGMAIADVGAGTGLFTRLFAKAVGEAGRVYAVDIAPNFIAHIEKSTKAAGLQNVTGVVGTDRSVELPENSVDLAFVCDTYHHFEYPLDTLKSIHRALKPGGRLVVIDFRRIEGESSDWVLSHVRAGQEVFTSEIEKSGFKLVGEQPLLKENYFLRFEKASPSKE